MTEPAAKRKRAEGSTLQRAIQSEPWLKDGNIVLEAEGNQFRVHRSILANHSSIFEDMFAMPQPSATNESELVEGCPVVKLSDTAADLQYVLKALCHRRCVFNVVFLVLFTISLVRSYVTIGLTPIPMSVVAAFLRLGKKYDIWILHAEAVKRLTYECPSSLEDFDKLELWSMIEAENGLPVEIVKLARETDLPSILPIALYCCCRCYTAPEILKGVKGKGGNHVALSSEDKETCIVANQRIIQAQAETTYAWMNPGHSSGPLYKFCRSLIMCASARKDLLCRTFLPLSRSIALDLWEVEWEDGMCDICIDDTKTSHNEGREKMWNDLPTFFNLPEWEELLKL